METKRGWVPGVAARASGRPSRWRQFRRLGVQVEQDLHMVGDEADRDHHHARRAGGGQLGEVVADVGASHGTDGGPLRLW